MHKLIKTNPYELPFANTRARKSPLPESMQWMFFTTSVHLFRWMGPTAKVVYRKLAPMLATRHYSQVEMHS